MRTGQHCEDIPAAALAGLAQDSSHTPKALHSAAAGMTGNCDAGGCPQKPAAAVLCYPGTTDVHETAVAGERVTSWPTQSGNACKPLLHAYICRDAHMLLAITMQGSRTGGALATRVSMQAVHLKLVPLTAKSSTAQQPHMAAARRQGCHCARITRDQGSC
jgi:hypothetical protein